MTIDANLIPDKQVANLRRKLLNTSILLTRLDNRVKGLERNLKDIHSKKVLEPQKNENSEKGIVT